VLAELDRLEAEQWLGRDEVVARHRDRLGRMLSFALDRVPHYRRAAAAAGLEAGAPRRADDLPALPILARADLADRARDLVPDEGPPAGSTWNHTGGSTGTPVAFLQDEAYRVANLAATARHDRWAGWDFGVRTALLWGVDRDLAAARGARERASIRFARRQVELDAFRMGEPEMEEFTARLARFRPGFVRGYSSSLDLYADFLVRRGRPFRAPAGVLSCAETLDDERRARIASAFSAPVFDRYGSREFGPIASQCAEGRYHVNTHGVWVEVLDGDAPCAPGALGRVVVTGLVCRAMPLLRYDTGDAAQAPAGGVCPCGRGLPALGRIEGRVSDFVVSADGRMLHGEFVTHLFYGRSAVRAFLLEQDAHRALTLRVVGEGAALEGQVREAVDRIRRETHGLEIRVERVASIEDSPSGKRRFVRSAAAASLLDHARPTESRR
jgi:phenylacetate-coenzyme A ligase PaaK-like adenylate-forming protein